MIDVEAEDRFRVTAACLLLTAYQEENLTHHRPHPMRAAALEAVEPHTDHACAKLFREWGAFGSQFYRLAAWLAPSPPFQWLAPFGEVSGWAVSPEDAQKFDLETRYPELLTSFLEEARLVELWASTQAEWKQVGEQCRRGLERYDVEGWMESFWGAAPKRLVLVPNPTDPPSFGFGPSNRGEAFCIIGPPTVPRSVPEESAAKHFDYGSTPGTADMAVHEFGHTLIDAAGDELSQLAKESGEIGSTLELKDWFPRMYPDWRTRLCEIILKAVQGTWRAEKISEESADEVIEAETRRFGIEPLPLIYQLLRQEREAGRTLGPEGCVEAARRALVQFSKERSAGGGL
jgi:hypothetical protein